MDDGSGEFRKATIKFPAEGKHEPLREGEEYRLTGGGWFKVTKHGVVNLSNLTDAAANLSEQIRYRAYGDIRGRWDGAGTPMANPSAAYRYEFTSYETELSSRCSRWWAGPPRSIHSDSGMSWVPLVSGRSSFGVAAGGHFPTLPISRCQIGAPCHELAPLYSTSPCSDCPSSVSDLC